MNNVVATYKILPGIKLKKKGTMPTRWGDVTPSQLVGIYLLTLPKVDIDKCISMMLNFPKWIVKRLTTWEKYNITESLWFANKESFFDSFIVKSITLNGREYPAPKDKLKDLPFGQFILIDTYHSEFMEGGTNKQLAKFLSVLYTDNYEQALQHPFIDVDMDLGNAIAFNYTLIRLWLQKRYTFLFPAVSEEEKKKKRKINKRDYGWLGVFDNLVGTDIINHDKYAGTPTHNVLRFLNNTIKEQRKNGSKF